MHGYFLPLRFRYRIDGVEVFLLTRDDRNVERFSNLRFQFLSQIGAFFQSMLCCFASLS